MTIREVLGRKRKRFVYLGIAACVGALTALLLSVSSGTFPWLFLPFFACFGASVLGIMFFLKCPRCSGSLGRGNVPFEGTSAGIRRPINYCPYCGVSLDEQMQQAA
jgi:uncharacterized membrane protein YedE/YeeE